MTNKESGLIKIQELVARFSEQLTAYKRTDYNETQTRRDFIDPFFKALGWDIDNEQGFAESYREVIHEDKLKIGKATKAPDYSFRLGGGNRLFFVEAKKPSVFIKDEIQPAYQVRRYGWSAKLDLSIITDFEEFAIYDCTKKPNLYDKSSVARIKYFTYNEYIKEWNFLWETFSKEAVLKGSFDKYIGGKLNKKGTATVDKDFLNSLDQWRTILAESISKYNKNLNDEELNFVVQQNLDRIIFLRICEDRSIEPYGSLQNNLKGENIYHNFLQLFKQADDKYNSGLFDFNKDSLSKQIIINNKTLKLIINQLYYPVCPYEFSVISVEILGSAYEQFLGKTITINNRGKAIIELKPEVRKAGGVFYTPKYIVDYIVENTIGKLIKKGNMHPCDVENLKIVDPACGSGSFLLGAYQYLLDWHKDYYTNISKNSAPLVKNKLPLTPEGNLTTNEKKKILLNNIYGVDIDTNAVEVTKLSLLLKCLEGETKASIEHQMIIFKDRVLPTLDNNIKSGNSLIDTDYYDNQVDFGEERKIKPFNWQKAFQSVFNRYIEIDKTLPFKEQYNKVKKLDEQTQGFINSILEEPKPEYGKKFNGGFDVVIGNPPYVSVKLQEYYFKNYINNKYKFSKNADKYVAFIEKGLSLLNENGLLGFIVPNKFFGADYGKAIRNELKINYHINSILDEKDNKVFQDALISCIALTINKKYKDDKTIIYRNNQVFEFNYLDIFDNNDKIQIESTNEEKLIISKIELNQKLKTLCSIRTGIMGFEYWKMQDIIFDKGKIEKYSIPIYTNGNFNRYFDGWEDKEINLYKKKYSKPTINLDINYINKKTIDFFNQKPKIIVRGVAQKVSAIIDNKGSALLVAVHAIIPKKLNINYFLGLINSSLINWFHLKTIYSIRIPEGSLKYPVSFFNNLPIKDIDLSNKLETDLYNQIIANVEILLNLYNEIKISTLESQKENIKQKIDYHEDKINSTVYKLYDLTETEINIIENGLSL